MKKLILFSLIFILNPHFSFSQNWEWSKKTSVLNSNYQKGLFTDNTGRVFSYSSGNFQNLSIPGSSILTDTIGSTLKCYNATGTLLYTKRWMIPFYITKIAYDGNASLYFSAVFYGNLNINGISISSMGDTDGAIGKMDLSGNVLWLATFGGNENDKCLGICFNTIDNSVYASGAIKNSLSFNNTFVSSGQQSGIICRYNTSGILLQHKRYDYVPGRDTWEANRGLEIACNKNGDLYVLMDRDGQHPFGPDSISGAYMGRYVMKLNNSLDTIWSKLIIGPECYYGYACNSLQVAANGDTYVTRQCSHKYGGDASLWRLRSADGQKIWTYPNNDGRYTNIYIDSNTVYVIGVEGANGCPCPSNNPGYNVVKIFDENNVLTGETRSSAAFSFITKSHDSGIYIDGHFWSRTCTLGPDVIIADSSLYSSGTSYYYIGTFLSRLGDINCTAPVITANIGTVYGQFYTLCPTDTATLTTNLSTGSFLWSDSSTTATTSTAGGGNFSVVNTQPNGCVAYSLPVSIVVNENESSHKICIATYDKTSGRNNLLISTDDYEQSGDIEEIHFYKELDGVIIHIGSKTGSNVWAGNLFIDSTSNPGTGPISYFIKTIDSCGTISPASESHTTVLVKGGKDASGKNILRWNHYSGFPVKQYKIWRGESFATMQLYDSAAKFKTSYTDEDISSVLYYYQIEASRSPYGCYSTEENKIYFSSFSKIVNCAGLLALRSVKPELDVYPNPAESRFTIRCTTYEKCDLNVKIHNTIGEVIYAENIKGFTGEYNKMISLELYPKGIYFLTVGSENESASKKIVLQ